MSLLTHKESKYGRFASICGKKYFRDLDFYKPVLAIRYGNRGFRHLTFAVICAIFFLTSCGGGSDGGSAGQTDSAPAKVESIETTPGDTIVTLDWGGVNLAETYSIYWSNTIDEGIGGNLIENVSPGYMHTGLVNGSTYFYSVVAVNNFGQSDVSDESRATPSQSTRIADLLFNDPNLQQCVQDAGPSVVFIYQLLFLDCAEKGITDISGIEQLTSLTFLDLSKNAFADLSPLGNLQGLEFLRLVGNNSGLIASLSPVSTMINLTTFDFGNHGQNYNNFNNLSDLIHLTTLYISDNNVINISVLSNFPKLIRLEIGGSNNIMDFSVLQDLTDLIVLNIRSTGASDVSFLSNLTKLEDLRIAQNPISDISALANLAELSYLDMSLMNVSNLNAISGLENLSYLNALKNNLIDISGLEGLNVRTLFLGYNFITDFSPLSGNEVIKFFSAEFSGLTNLDFLSNSAESTLQHLRLYGNNFTSAVEFARYTNLIQLQLPSNNLGDSSVGNIDLLGSLTNIEILNISNNPNISCSELTSLINAVGSPPVDVDWDSDSADVATDGVNCTNP